MNKIVTFLLLIVFGSCTLPEQDITRNEPLEVLTELLEVNYNSAKLGVVIGFSRTGYAVDVGICWSETPNPTIDDHLAPISGGSRPHVTSTLSGLNEHTTYYARAYASNIGGFTYGNEIRFETKNFNQSLPCTPTKNTIVFNLSEIELKNIVASTNHTYYGDYAVYGSAMSASFRVEFSAPPVSGVYETDKSGSLLANECAVNGTFGFFGTLYIADNDQKVYVKKLGGDKYEINFCNLHFTSGSTTYEFDTDGNLSTE